jgi:serine/threonine protein phosphatase 1
MATYVIADIHGNLLGLADVLHKCKFREDDTLISLGDVVDGGILTKDVIDVLLEIPNLINIRGNHDNPWALQWMRDGSEYPLWWNQGGRATAQSYEFHHMNVPKRHIDFLAHSVPYYIDNKNRVFVHGGFDPSMPIEDQFTEVLTWDRSLLCDYAPDHVIKGYNHVFVGHTSTQFLGGAVYPVTFNNLTGMDTGGGWNGKLSIMDVDTFEVWQSDINANIQKDIIRDLENSLMGD